jgi:secondary thiamine-phosphate synthase enzyme
MSVQEQLKYHNLKMGFYDITSDIDAVVCKNDIDTGLVHIFLKHTSASLTINENADPLVLKDFKNFLEELADDKPYYEHTYEGADDMPSHIKSSLLGVSLQVPITNGRLNLGTWQGIYLCEHRYHSSVREVVVTVLG